jgi:adenine-specific DNA-methyltransferase
MSHQREILGDITGFAELLRIDAGRHLPAKRRDEFGQFLTPLATARLLASMLTYIPPHIELLEAGAGVGSLIAAAVESYCQSEQPPQSLVVTAYEIDPLLAEYLHQTLAVCQQLCVDHGIRMSYTIIRDDFIAHAVDSLNTPLFSQGARQFTSVILNPPYRKLHSDSEHRRLLRSVGIETSNLYTAFLSLAIKLLGEDGELIAITPRSFCNGPYFRPFRTLLLDTMALQQLYVFEARDKAFAEDAVLQENIILSARKSLDRPRHITLTVATHPDDDLPNVNTVPYHEVVHPDDAERFIRLVSDAPAQQVSERMGGLGARLSDLGLTVSTGRVVDFRAADALCADPEPGTVPLIYPQHIDSASIRWPQPNSRKPNAIRQSDVTRALLVPNAWYVLVKRFSAKEEPRRVVAAVIDPALLPGTNIGIENHLNYFHANGSGLDPLLAMGLAAFLNSRLVDSYVRQFSGHTQINATDLRNLRYPTQEQLRAIGQRINRVSASPELDAIVAEELGMSETSSQNSSSAQQRVQEALEVLRDLGFPRQQLNERSALTLLALLDITPEMPWSAAQAPLRGITPMMDFFAAHYGKQYRPNTRETVRRQTVHQFLDAGLIVANPDKPERPINSPKAVYQIEALALELLRAYGSDEWPRVLYNYRIDVESLKQRYAQERALARIPINLQDGTVLSLSPGGQNVLIKQILDEFAARFTSGGKSFILVILMKSMPTSIRHLPMN